MNFRRNCFEFVFQTVSLQVFRSLLFPLVSLSKDVNRFHDAGKKSQMYFDKRNQTGQHLQVTFHIF